MLAGSALLTTSRIDRPFIPLTSSHRTENCTFTFLPLEGSVYSSTRSFNPPQKATMFRPDVLVERRLTSVSHRSNVLSTFLLLATTLAGNAHGLHHMKRAPLVYVVQRDKSVPLVVTNLCAETIYPGILTQSGSDPGVGGFQLQTGATRNLTVGSDWQGRVWGRTNCSFNFGGTGPSNTGGNDGGGRACLTGDCGGIINCKGTVSAAPNKTRHGLACS